MKKKENYSLGSKILTVFFVLLCLFWVMPIFEVLINSFKENAAVNINAFALKILSLGLPTTSRA